MQSTVKKYTRLCPRGNRVKILALIHVAKKKLNLSEENYRAMLFSTTKKHSTKEMSDKELIEVVHSLDKLGFQSTNKNAFNSNTWTNQTGRTRGKYEISLSQERYIKSLWQKVAREKTDEALNSFIKRVCEKNNLESLDKAEASKLIMVLKKLPLTQ